MMSEIRIPIADIAHVADTARRVCENNPLADLGPMYAVVTEGQIELRQGSNVSFGVRRFTPIGDAGEATP